MRTRLDAGLPSKPTHLSCGRSLSSGIKVRHDSAILVGNRKTPLPRGGAVALLALHPDRQEMAAAMKFAEQRSQATGASCDAVLQWLPGLRQAVGAQRWPAVRTAAGRIIVRLWRRSIDLSAAGK